jgi:predicted phage terminase large subunit-like protein
MIPLLNKYIKNKPFPKQLGFLMLPHMEALYGGQAGGGKSDILLSIALQYVHIPGYAAIVFRRTLTDLKQPSALIDRSFKWLSDTDAKWQGDEHCWYFPTTNPDGRPGHPARLQFGYIGESNAYTRYQSAEYQCVAKGTEVLMGDGSYKAIELIKVNDLVMTLSGPKPVTHTFPSMKKECVRIGNQVQGVTHKVLTSTGQWSLVSSSPIECCIFHRSDLLNLKTNQNSLTYHDIPNLNQVHIYEQFQSLQDHPLFEDFYDKLTNDQIFFGESYELPQNILLSPKLSFFQQIPEHPYQSHHVTCLETSLDGDRYDDYTYQLSSNSLDCYSSYHDQYDAQFHHLLKTYQVSSPSLACAEEPIHSFLLLDATSRFQIYNHKNLFWYNHPYNLSSLHSSEVFPSFVTYYPEYVGERTVYDITVADENHFITKEGLVNRNCILFDEVTQHEESNYTYMFSRLRKLVCLKHRLDDKGTPIYVDNCEWCQLYKSLPLRVRGATNPGGIGHEWVRNRFKIEPQDGRDPYTIPEDDTTVVWVGRHPDKPFLQASYRDNPYIDQQAYAKALEELAPVERARLKYGNWAVNPDSRFKRAWSRYYSVRGDYFVLGKNGVGRPIDWKSLQKIFITVDPAASLRSGMAEFTKGKDPSYTVISVWGLTQDFHLLWLDMDRFQDEIPEVVKRIQIMYKKWRPQYVKIEANGAGRGVFQYCQVYGLNVKPITKQADKVVNSTTAQVKMEHGRVWFPEHAHWLKAAEDEVFNWTGDGNQKDDIVDTLSDACNDILWEAGDDRDGTSSQEYQVFSDGPLYLKM